MRAPVASNPKVAEPYALPRRPRRTPVLDDDVVDDTPTVTVAPRLRKHVADLVAFVKKRHGDDSIGLASDIEAVPHCFSTGIVEFDDAIGVTAADGTTGFPCGKVVQISGPESSGKALALDTFLPTPDGWTTMLAVKVGDLLFGRDGRVVRVVAVTDVLHGRPCFAVSFFGGETIVADAQHSWITWSNEDYSRSREPTVRTTVQIREKLYRSNSSKILNHKVPMAAPVYLRPRKLSVDPYALGVWLGDGTSAEAGITSFDEEILLNLEVCGVRVIRRKTPGRYGLRVANRSARGERLNGNSRCWSVASKLRDLRVLKDKHIPSMYLRASEAQRRDLLAGLLDTDGTVSHTGAVELSLTNERLARDAEELIASLGYRVSTRTKLVRGRSSASSTCFTVSFSTCDKVFYLTRKNSVHSERHSDSSRSRSWASGRKIKSIEPVESTAVRCIQVDALDGCFLVSRHFIPTHNSTLCKMLIARGQQAGIVPNFIDGEMSAESPERFASLGVSPDTLPWSEVQYVEDAFELVDSSIERMAKWNDPSVIFIDSIASLEIKKVDEHREFVEQGVRAPMASFLSRNLGKLVHKLKGTQIGLVLVNQMREKPNAQPFQDPTYEPGGRALRHWCHLHLRMTRVAWITEGTGPSAVKVGIKSRVQVKKSKLGIPMRSVILDILFDGTIRHGTFSRGDDA